MATFSPDAGVNEREPTLIPDGALQDTDGAEYRVGQPGLYVARGRGQVGDLGALPGGGLGEAGASGTLPIVGGHYANRHYTANGVANRRLELATGITSFPIGMSTSTFAVGV